MELTHDLAHDTGALLGLAIKAQAHVVHAEQNTALDGFKAVAGIRQGTGNNHRHGVVDIRGAHFVVYLHLLDVAGSGHLLQLILLFVIVHFIE